jgi:HSP20 family protein
MFESCSINKQGKSHMTYLTPQKTWFRPASVFDANSPFLSALNRQIDRAVEDSGEFQWAAGTQRAQPRMSVSETDHVVEIEAELPGVQDKDLEVSLNGDVLTIKGEKRMEREEQQKDCCHQERAFGRFSRSIDLSFEPDAKTVKTLFSRGVLKITLPKSAGVKQHMVKIPVTAVS